MTVRDPNHQERLKAVQVVTLEELKRLLEITNYKDPSYLPSEVLVSLLRLRHREAEGFVDKAGATLYRRVFERITWLIPKKTLWQRAAKKDSEFVGEAASYLWEKLVEDLNKEDDEPSFAEVRFKRFLRCHVTDYARQQVHKIDNKAKSLDAMRVGDDAMEGKDGVPFIETLKDERGDTTAKIVEVTDEFWKYIGGLEDGRERQAVVLRDVYGHDWDTITKEMGCSEPTARGYYKRGKETAPRRG